MDIYSLSVFGEDAATRTQCEQLIIQSTVYYDCADIRITNGAFSWGFFINKVVVYNLIL